MKIAYFDCPAGASGDMILGALVDAGLPLATLESALAGLGVAGWRLGARVVEKGGLRGMKVEVESDPSVRFDRLDEMLAQLDKGWLAPAVRERVEAILRRLAEAEARVHRVPVYDNGIAAELLTPTGAAILTTLA
ncbi:MAG: DUF111 family protein, partial [Candidatus Rokubacteria bacterium]|nr:DUF111 family protein [Candidatus Rokubacteria bacterium]